MTELPRPGSGHAASMFIAIAGLCVSTQAFAQTTPAEIVKAFYKACNDGKYLKAERLVTKDSLERLADVGLAGSLSAYCEDLTERGTLKKLYVLSEKVRGEGAVVRFKFLYENGSDDEGREALVKRGGVWKIELLQTGDARF